MRTTTPFLLATLVLSFAGACAVDPVEEPTGPDPATVEVTVSWVPPSTAEEYRNGRSLGLSEDGIVRQQGQDDPTTEPMDPQRWDDFVGGLPGELDDIEDEGESCTGAGGTTLSVEGAGDLDREIIASVCGGESPPAAEQIDALVADFR